MFARLEQAGWEYSIGVRMTKQIKEAVAADPRAAPGRRSPTTPSDGEAQIAETTSAARRLIVRRTRLLGSQAELWPDWRHYAFLTNRTDAIALVEAEHRQHAVVELVIPDLKDQALAHFPSGKFNANAAWTVIAALAHNLLRWTTADRAARHAPSAPPAHYAAGCCAFPAGSPATPAAGHSASPLAGPGKTTSSPHWPGSARSPPPDASAHHPSTAAA